MSPLDGFSKFSYFFHELRYNGHVASQSNVMAIVTKRINKDDLNNIRLFSGIAVFFYNADQYNEGKPLVTKIFADFQVFQERYISPDTV